MKYRSLMIAIIAIAEGIEAHRGGLGRHVIVKEAEVIVRGQEVEIAIVTETEIVQVDPDAETDRDHVIVTWIAKNEENRKNVKTCRFLSKR